MSSFNIVKHCAVKRTPRVLQVEGMFSMQPEKVSTFEISGELSLDEREWDIGLIVGPSGSGKSTLAAHVFQERVFGGFEWDDDKSILDGFPSNLSIKEIVSLLSSVGFSSPPSWLRPYRVLSTGEKMRVDVAQLLALKLDIAVMDEFTSVVDRTVAQIGSAAIAKAVRKRGQKFVAVTCHYDVLDWLQPDWVYQTQSNEFLWRFPGSRPDVRLNIHRVERDAWEIFRKYHYLSTVLNKSSRCFGAFLDERIVAFVAVLHFPHSTAKNIKREHRLVCLPDFQGVGIGSALSNYVAAYYVNRGFRYFSQTSHPAMIASRNRSTHWIMRRKPSIKIVGKSKSRARDLRAWQGRINDRLVASFEYVQ